VSAAGGGHAQARHGPPVIGRPRLHLRQTDSTNARARELAITGAPHGTLVTAAFQTAGRGRQGRRWLAPPDSSVLASLVLRSPPPLLPLIAAVAVCDVAPATAQIKWPNDVVIARERAPGDAPGPPAFAKLAGVLIEGRPQEDWAVVGIGLNVALGLEDLPLAARATAATLGRGPDEIEPTLAALLTALSRRLAEPREQTLAAWRGRDALDGREIAWERAGPDRPRERGRAAGIDGEGRLVVSLAGGGQTTLQAGEVHLLDGA